VSKQGDMRWIKLKAFIGGEPGEAYTSSRLLCDYCGHMGQCDKEQTTRRQFDTQKVRQCGTFLPVLSFADITGTEDDFSTYRVGKAWGERVRIGQSIALFDLGTQEIYGYAIVIAMFIGNRDELLFKHAKTNHLLKAKNYSNASEAGFYFEKLLRRLMGNMIFDNNRFATVLYLRREK